METKARLQIALDELNQLLGEVTPYKLAIVAPEEVKSLDKNARYMSKRVYDQLTANIAQDGNLSSLPFCWRMPDGAMESLSGNHRVKTAAAAGVEAILVLYTDEELSKSQRVAIQLSHNALVGQDNPTVLNELWREIGSFEGKIYSGLDEDALKTMENVSVVRIQESRLRFEELTLYFVPAEIDEIETVLKQLGSTAKHRFITQVEDFDKFFETLLDFKEAAGIVSTSTAFLAMIEIMAEWLEHNAPEQEDEQEKRSG